MLSKEQLLELNLKMISLGEPIQRDNIGYNRPDFVFAQRFIGTIDDKDCFELCKRLKKYTTKQISEYQNEIKDTLSFYDKKYKKNRKLSLKRSKQHLFVDVKIEKDIALVYIPKPPSYLRNYLEFEVDSNIAKVKLNQLNSLLQLLNSNRLTVKRSVWKNVKQQNLHKNSEYGNIFEEILEEKKELLKKEREFNENNKELTTENSLIIKIREDDKRNKQLILKYPRQKQRSKDIIYQILKSLDFGNRVYFEEANGLGNFYLSYEGVIHFIKDIKKYNENSLVKINYDCLTPYIQSTDTRFKVKVEKIDINKISISFAYNAELVEFIKTLPKDMRKWDAENKKWILNFSILNNVYEFLQTIKIKGESLNLIGFEEIVNEEPEYKLDIKYIGGKGIFSIYKICPLYYDENLNKILKKYDISRYQNENHFNLLSFKEIISELELNTKLDVSELKNICAEYDKLERNKVFPAIDYSVLNKKPFKHQVEALNKMLELKRFILADEMGLGKTLETILWGMSYPYKKIIICPAALKLNWKKEILSIDSSLEVSVVTTKKFEPLKTNNGWLIINYDLLEKYIDEICKFDFKVIGIDEAHLIKAIKTGGKPNSKRAKNVLKLCEEMPFKAVITGTPINNKTKDIWNLLKVVEHPLTANFFDFAKRYCDAYNSAYGFVFDGSSNKEELYNNLQPYMIRRLKEEVLDLPDKIRTFIPNEINLKEYNKKLKDYMKNRTTLTNEGEHLVYLNALRHILAKEKIDSTIELADLIVAEGKPVVIFSCYTEPLKKLEEHFKDDIVILDGSTPENKRQEVVDTFQNGKVNIIACNIKSGGVGITLTRSAHIIFNDYDWLPANHIQGEERIHRIGQNNKCQVIYNYASNTEIDISLTSLLDDKLKNISNIIDNKEISFKNENMFNQILSIF